MIPTRRFAAARAAAASSLLAVFLLAVAGCASAPRGAGQPAAGEDLWRAYAKAVEAAKVPRPDHVSKDLVPLLTFTPGLVWDQGGQSGQKVLMSTWTYAKYYTGTPPYDYTVPSQVEVWLTAVPLLRRFCHHTGLTGPALTLRLAQRLGLPPDASDDAFVQMWVDPRTVFRPCPDPEITDRECQVNLTAGKAASPPSCPWSAALAGQVSGAFVTVTQKHLDWMCANWIKSYPGDPRKSYPWTALGYTYDWGGGQDFYGESEFVIPSGTRVVIESVTPTDAYCASAGPP